MVNWFWTNVPNQFSGTKDYLFILSFFYLFLSFIFLSDIAEAIWYPYTQNLKDRVLNIKAKLLISRREYLWPSVQFSCSVVSDSLWPHGLQHPRTLLTFMSIESVMPYNHLILSSPSPPVFNLSQHQSESEVAQSCPTLCDPMEPLSGSSVHEIFQARVLEWVAISFSRGSSQPRGWTRVSCIRNRHFTIWATREVSRVFSNQSALRLRWPKYWSFSFNISPSNEHPGLISFRMDWLDLLAIQATLKSLLQHHSSKAAILQHSAFFVVQLSYPYMTNWKNCNFD